MIIFFIAFSFILITIAIVVVAILSARQETEIESKTLHLPYRCKQYFFTQSEQVFFNILNAGLDAHQYTVFPKVRLGDIVEVDKSLKHGNGAWSRIRSRHIDFIVWDLTNKKIVLAIELDGKSHNSEKARLADNFKNDVFNTVGVQLQRVKVGSDFESEVKKIAESLAKV